MAVLVGGHSVHLHDIAGANDPLAGVYAIKMWQRKLQTSVRWVRFAHGNGLHCICLSRSGRSRAPGAQLQSDLIEAMAITSVEVGTKADQAASTPRGTHG